MAASSIPPALQDSLWRVSATAGSQALCSLSHIHIWRARIIDSCDIFLLTIMQEIFNFTIKNIFFIFFLCLFFIYYLCENIIKPFTVQYYIASCVSWVPSLTLLDLMNKLDLQMCSQNGTHS